MESSSQLQYLISLLQEFCKLPSETEWLEFKHNNADPEELGEYISALANSATLLGKIHAYIIWGVNDKTRAIIGTSFKPSNTKVGNEELESWLLRLLFPKINFHFYEFMVDSSYIVLLEINAAFRHPVQFKNNEFIRVGSYKKKLKDFPEKERELWRLFDKIAFEHGVAAENITGKEILNLLDYPAFFDLMAISSPTTDAGIFSALEAEEIITPIGKMNKWNINNLGAVCR